jgi:hypothetical protein
MTAARTPMRMLRQRLFQGAGAEAVDVSAAGGERRDGLSGICARRSITAGIR